MPNSNCTLLYGACFLLYKECYNKPMRIFMLITFIMLVIAACGAYFKTTYVHNPSSATASTSTP